MPTGTLDDRVGPAGRSWVVPRVIGADRTLKTALVHQCSIFEEGSEGGVEWYYFQSGRGLGSSWGFWVEVGAVCRWEAVPQLDASDEPMGPGYVYYI